MSRRPGQPVARAGLAAGLRHGRFCQGRVGTVGSARWFPQPGRQVGRSAGSVQQDVAVACAAVKCR
eukprot:6694054-Lingulodinium_polyedra.AAC.1